MSSDNYTMKPFCQIVDVDQGIAAYTTKTGVNLVDTSGTLIHCNHIRVECVSGFANNTNFLVELSSLGAVSGHNPEGSAICGKIGLCDPRGGDTSVEFDLSDAHRVHAIAISLGDTGVGSRGFSVSYGYKKFTRNPMRGGAEALRADGS